ncbi:MAG: Ig-like domain-containing protein [Eubacterium sp.]|nr:Ig-like domain-containing protein [Eubacterium sp.]
MREKMKYSKIIQSICMIILALIISGMIISFDGVYTSAAGNKIYYPDGKDTATTPQQKPEEGHVFVEVQGSYAEDTIQQIVDRVNEIRKEACDKGLPRPRFSVSKEIVNLSPSDYKPVVWSSDLQGAAQIRAAEINVFWNHARPCGSYAPDSIPFKSEKNDADSRYENIALIGYKTNVLDAIDLWYEEMEAYENLYGLAQYNSGHYLAMIDPRVECIGIATINGFTAGEFGCKLEENIRSDDVSIKGDIVQLVDVKDELLQDYCLINGTNIVEALRGTVGTQFKNDIYCKIGNYLTYEGSLYYKVYSGVSLFSENTKILSIDSAGTMNALANGSTYIDMNSANITSKVNVNVVAIDTVKPLADITVPSGISPYSKLPKTVSVVWSDGIITDEEVVWTETENETYKNRKGGTFTVEGSVTKYGKNVIQKVVVNPATVSSITEPDEITTKCCQKPAFPKTLKVKWSNGDVTDETVTWDSPQKADYNNINGGTFKVSGSVQGKNVSIEYKVIPPVSVNVTVILQKDKYKYNGDVITPKISVYIDGRKADVESYTVKYSDGRKNVGKYTVNVTLKPNSGYKGSGKGTFIIQPKGTRINKLKTTKKNIKVSWKNSNQVTGYEVQYSLKKSFSSNVKKKTIKGAKKNSIFISKLKSNKKYYVRIRTYKTVNGNKYYSSWSKVKAIKVK